MEVEDVSRLAADELFAYFRTRLPVGIYLPLALFLYTAGVAAGRRIDARSFALGLTLAYTLLLQFRLWDDLNSRGQDRLEHPERVLSKVKALLPFHKLFFLSLVFNCAVLFLEPDFRPKLAGFIALNGGLLLWYRRRLGLSLNKIINSHVVLAKYPLFVYLLSDTSRAASTPYLLSLSVVYLCFCVYELLHDKTLWTAPWARRVLGVEMLALVVVYGLMAAELRSSVTVATVTQVILTTAGGLASILLFFRHRSQTISSNWNYAVIIIGFAGLVNFSLGNKL